jgi:hypothetical protein
MSTDDFLEFDDEGASDGSSGRRPFLILAGALVTVLILASVCTFYVYTNQSQDGGAALQTRESDNATAIANNVMVAETIAAMETEAALPPTETPPPPATFTPEAPPTDTPAPTETPVVSQTGEGETGTGEAEVTGDETAVAGETGAEATVEGETSAETDDTTVETDTTTDDTSATGVVSSDGTDNGRSDPALSTDNSEAALPQTGLETWSAILIALFLVGVVIAARRFRST